MMMMNKENFISWLGTHTKLKAYSIRRYANAIDTLSNEFEEYGISKGGIFDKENIEKVLINRKFKEKNKKENRMHSAALIHLKAYIEHDHFQAELLIEELEFEKYLRVNTVVKSNKIIVDKAKEKPEFKIINNRKLWIRNPKYASEAIGFANYTCEFNNQHGYFISKFTEKNYVEAHHLIPMQFQEQFNYSLDVYANIVSLCLVCHKQLHYGLFDDKKEILDKLYASRIERLITSGIDIEVSTIYSYYQD